MRLTHRLTAILVTLTIGVGLMMVAPAARASEEGRRNTAIALGAAAGYLLLREKNKLPGIVAAAGAAYAYKRYEDKVKARHRRERYGYYYDDDYRYNDRYDRDRYGRYDDDCYNRDRDRYHRSRDRYGRYRDDNGDLPCLYDERSRILKARRR